MNWDKSERGASTGLAREFVGVSADGRSEGTWIGVWLIYWTMFGLFSEAFYVYYKFEIKLFYLIVLLGLAACLYIWDLRINIYHVLALTCLAVSGAWGVSAGQVQLFTYIEQIVGITICSTYFYIFLRNQPFGLVGIFETYAKAAYWVSLIGLIIVPFQSAIVGLFMPVRSFMREPTHFASVVLPAAFYFVAKRNQGYKKEAWVTVLALLLSRSATGYLGLMLGTILLLKNRRNGIIAVLLISITAIALYAFEPHFQIRVDDTIKAVTTVDVTGVNLSTYALLSNAFVTACILQKHPLIGYGLGGHRVAHDEFIGDLPGSDTWDQESLEYNKNDADSLLLRTASELGLLGVLAEIFFIVTFFVRGNSEYALINCAILLYFATKLLRDGHWFSPEMYFFIWLYIFVALEHRRLGRKSAKQLQPLRSPSLAFLQ